MAPLATNSRARFDYELLDTFVAGLELEGFEVKAVRAGKLTLSGSHVIVRGGEAYLVGASLEPYQAANVPTGFHPRRTIRLLLTKKELKFLTGAGQERGLTLVPLSVYNKGRYLKLEFALGRGKKKFDKRQKIKERETNREVRRTLKRSF